MCSKNWFYFLHVTDTHLCSSKEKRRLGKPPYENLERLVNFVKSKKLKLDFVIHSGDIAGASELGQPQAYEDVKFLLDSLNVPTYYAIGNHDDPKLVKNLLLPGITQLGQNPDRIAYSFSRFDVRFFFLDARLGEAPDSFLPKDQLEALDLALENLVEKSAVIVNHYQVLPIDVPWFSTVTVNNSPSSMMMENGLDLHRVLAKHSKKIKGVFQGHIHSSLTWSKDNLIYYSAASTDTNISNWPGEEREQRLIDDRIGFNYVGICGDQMVVRHIQL